MQFHVGMSSESNVCSMLYCVLREDVMGRFKYNTKD